MSEVKVNKISPRTNCGTVTLGDSGDSFTIPSGVTITNNGTQTGFGRTGTVDWQTGSIKTANFTAENGKGYFCNTSGGAFTATLPASPSAGDIVAFADYTRTFQTNSLTVGRNSENIGGDANDSVLSTKGQSVTFVYVDATEGWINVHETSNSVAGTNPFIEASGGTETTSGDYKIHTFTGPGTFTVTNAGLPTGSNTVDYLVIAGGAGAGSKRGGGGGAGGYRESSGAASGCYTRSPLGACVSALPVTASPYPITVGAGGSGQTTVTPGGGGNGSNGNNSIFSTITSAGGGFGTAYHPTCACMPAGNPGGSGGGGGRGESPHVTKAGGTGNTPPVSPPQGQSGGSAPNTAPRGGGGGGGATQAGTSRTPGCGAGADGGDGATSSINGTPTARGGGGAGSNDNVPQSGGTGGAGGGGNSNPNTPGCNGTANTGGGGGGGYDTPASSGGSGGSGIVIIGYKYQ